MDNNDWFIMSNMSKLIPLLLPIMILSSCVEGCKEMLDPHLTKIFQEEQQKDQNFCC